MRRHLKTSVASAVVWAASGIAGAQETATGVIQFDRGTDTIHVGGQTELTMAATFEARFFLREGDSGGQIFNEWQAFAEDKYLYASPAQVCAYDHPIGFGQVLCVVTAVTTGVWHHVAYVYDGAEERMYLDGQRIAARAASGTIGNSPGEGYIGSIFRDGSQRLGFVGRLDFVRVSNVARYTGASFVAPTGDAAAEPGTMLLYAFRECPPSTTTADAGPLGRTGVLGEGIGGTMPQFLTTNTADFDGNGLLNVQDFLAFLQAFAAGDGEADFDRSGSINLQDFLVYLAAFARAC
jgi:hypothetical protein